MYMIFKGLLYKQAESFCAGAQWNYLASNPVAL